MGFSRSELSPDLRSFALGYYLIFYVPLQNGIDVVRVLQAMRDIDSLF